MIAEANKKKYAFLKDKEQEISKRLKEPLGKLEILTQFREEVRLDHDSQDYVKAPTKYYHIWCLFMVAIKEDPVDSQFLITQQPFVCTIKTDASVVLPKITKNSKKIENFSLVKEIEPLPFPPVRKPEAGLHVITTPNIKEIETKEYSPLTQVRRG